MSDTKVTLDLDTNRFFTANAENDKNTTLQLGVYKGTASWTVFANRQISLKMPLPRQGMSTMARLLRKIVKDPNGTSMAITMRKWDQATSKMVVQSTLSINKDEKGIIYLNVSAPGFSATRFNIRGSLSWTVDGEGNSDAANSADATLSLADVISTDIPQACILTNEKRLPQQGGGNGGGNRPAGGGNGGGSSGGGDMFF